MGWSICRSTACTCSPSSHSVACVRLLPIGRAPTRTLIESPTTTTSPLRRCGRRLPITGAIRRSSTPASKRIRSAQPSPPWPIATTRSPNSAGRCGMSCTSGTPSRAGCHARSRQARAGKHAAQGRHGSGSSVWFSRCSASASSANRASASTESARAFAHCGLDESSSSIRAASASCPDGGSFAASASASPTLAACRAAVDRAGALDYNHPTAVGISGRMLWHDDPLRRGVRARADAAGEHR